MWFEASTTISHHRKKEIKSQRVIENITLIETVEKEKGKLCSNI
jgi:hypothetical protein